HDEGGEHGAEQRHRAQDVQEEWPERAGVGDHGFPIISARMASVATPAAQETALPLRSASSVFSSSVEVSPSAARRSASSRAFSWWRPPMPPSALATTQRASEIQIQAVPNP